jgi:lysophospholipase L1-like esterase
MAGTRIWRTAAMVTLLTAMTVIADAGAATQLLKVACVGDSITFGSGIKNRNKFSYPAQLGVMLGNGYKVRNFGVSGTTLLKKGDHPYWKTGQYKQAIKWNPDIVIIKLGTNDTKMKNWKYKDELETNLKELVQSFTELPSKPKVFPALPVPAFHGGPSINGDRVRDGVLPVVKSVAKELKLPVIDFYTPMLDKKQYFKDGVHPNANGAFFLAATVYKTITGKEYAGKFNSLKKSIESPLPLKHSNQTKQQ